MFAIEHSGVQPDIMVMAKGLASGMPIAAIGSSQELMSKWKTGTHGGTYGGGNAVVAAAACATIDVMIQEDLPNHATQMGNYLLQKLHDLKAHYPIIGDVRGRGLMIGTEFTLPNGEPASDFTKAVRTACVESKMLILRCGSSENVIRWIPPLVVTEDQIDVAVEIFAQAIQKSMS